MNHSHSRNPIIILLFTIILLPLLLYQSALAAQIGLAWDANEEGDLAGYKVYYGTTTGTYGSPIDVGNVTTYILTGLTSGQRYYVAVTAYDTSDNESGYSNEVNGVASDGAPIFTVTTNPTGLKVVVDGTSYTSPQTFDWTVGSSHTLSVSSPQDGSSGTRYIYSSWSDGGAQTHTITTPSSSTTYTASFTTQHRLITSASPPGGGTVNPSGTNWYNSGQVVAISATANTGYTFSNWSGGLSGSTNPTSITMNGPKDVVANFTQNQYTLTVNINPSSSGSVSKNPDKSKYVYGEQVTLTATANSGYGFSNWSGDTTGSSNPTTITINSNKVVTANFIAETISTPTAPNGPSSGNTGVSYTYSTGGSSSNLGHSVEYRFDWKGDATDLSPWGSATQSKTWTTPGSYNVRARARCATHTSVVSAWSSSTPVTITQATVQCTVTSNPTGRQITVDGSAYTAPQTFDWVAGSSHTLSASSPQSGGSGIRYVFSSWSDGGGQTHAITVPSSSATYTADFTTQHTLTTSVSPSGAGTVSPSGTNWYNSGQTFSVSATANAGYSFSNWSGDLSGSVNPASITMNSPKNVVANFNAIPPGHLSVTPSNGLNSSGKKGGPFDPPGQTYTLQNVGGTTINWTASKSKSWVSLSSSSGSLTPGASTTLTVSINGGADTLDVGSYSDVVNYVNTGNGNGNTSRPVTLSVAVETQTYTVATDPPNLKVVVDGVSYTAPQTFSWVVGSLHTLKATSPQGGSKDVRYVFASWSDGNPKLVRKIIASSSVTTYIVSFVTQYKLSTSVNPSGTGTVSPSGSTLWYKHGHNLSISAKAAFGYIFNSWSGDHSGTGNPDSITMDKPKKVVANFGPAPEEIFAPKAPKGAVSAYYTGISHKFSTGRASSNLLHRVEYQFDWNGDGASDLSPWGSATQSKIWTIGGNYNLRARARCVTHPDKISPWSEGLSISVAQKPFMFVLTPNGGESYLVGTTHTLSWNSGYLDPNGTIYLYYQYDGAWHPIAALPSTASPSYDWTVPTFPPELSSIPPKTPTPKTPARSTSIWIGNWVNNGWECWDSSDKSFVILYDAWNFKISGADKGGAAIWFEEDAFEGYGISIELGMFRIRGTYSIDAQRLLSGSYTLHDFSDETIGLGMGTIAGGMDRSDAKSLTIKLKPSDGTPVFSVSGVRLVQEPWIPADLAVAIKGSLYGKLHSLRIEPYQIGDEIYSHVFGFSGSGVADDLGFIEMEGYFFFARNNTLYGIYEMRGVVTDTGVFAGTLNPTLGKMTLNLMSDRK
jgi:hypothetical protein